MQNIEPDQVQLEHNAPQEPAPHTQEPLQYAPVASSDHDRRFQKVGSASTVGWMVTTACPGFLALVMSLVGVRR